MSKLRAIGYVVLNRLIAVFGTVAIETRIPHATPHSGSDVIWREWITSAIIAALIGVVANPYRTSNTAAWAWRIPGCRRFAE